MPEEYPTPSFNFKVEFDIEGITDNSSCFQEVSGLSAENDVMAYREGGENRFQYKLPGETKLSNLVLKKGFITDQKILDWWMDINLGNPVDIHDIKLILLDENGNPAMTWKIHKALPVAIETSGFEESKKRIAVEKLEFAFESMERLD
jgi:phage tail-like protein